MHGDTGTTCCDIRTMHKDNEQGTGTVAGADKGRKNPMCDSLISCKKPYSSRLILLRQLICYFSNLLLKMLMPIVSER